jgi:hypothetical protein
MLDVIKQLLDKDLVTEETRTQIEEAWEAKLSEVKETAKAELREEFAQRYEHDKAQMVEAVDRMMTEGLTKEIAEFVEDRKQLAAQRVEYKKNMKPHMEMLQKFISTQLANEMKELHTDRAQMAEQIKTLESFVTSSLAKELNEFETDKRSVVETRVKLVKEAKQKFAEIRSAFIKKASKVVETMVSESITKEMTQFKEDIKTARENNFGRKIFEAYASEYLSSYLNETSEVRKMQKQLDEAQAKIAENEKLLESTTIEKKKVEAEYKRDRVLSEMLQPLSGEKREVMSNLLETVQTDKLQTAFNKYLPHVMKDTKRASIISESKTETTGDRQAKPQAKETTEEVNYFRKLAGIK